MRLRDPRLVAAQDADAARQAEALLAAQHDTLEDGFSIESARIAPWIPPDSR